MEEPGSCLPGLPIDMEHDGARVNTVQCHLADSERGQRAQFVE